MSNKIEASYMDNRASSDAILVAISAVISLAVIGYLFSDSLSFMAGYWDKEEYSHGAMIPFISLFLIYQRLNNLPEKSQPGSWWGFFLMIAALFAFLLGELSSIYTVIQYGFLLALISLVISTFGLTGFRYLLAPLIYLCFMIPLPNFIYFNLSSQLQLVSSQIGVFIIRLFDIAVYLEGNVIDLGAIKLQVVEACSGLRYLFPLMSFGFLIACIYRAPVWHRILLFLSTIPITVLMNSFRIGIIGVTVDRWGISMAEGFLHDFEGWIIFMGCVVILFIEAAILHKLTKQPGKMSEKLQLDLPKLNISWRDFQFSPSRQIPLLASAALLVFTFPWLINLDERTELPPTREQFSSFPLHQAGWNGRESSLDRDVLGTLQLTDYIIADYRNTTTFLNDPTVNLYVAWYSSQKKGASIHSPRSCIPGGGWRMDEVGTINIESINHVSGAPLEVNRAIIRKGNNAQLVYYWFEGRGRNITNEYLAKWYIFYDSLLNSRSDGALVRVVTPVADGADIASSDARLKKFLTDFYPTITKFTP